MWCLFRVYVYFIGICFVIVIWYGDVLNDLVLDIWILCGELLVFGMFCVLGWNEGILVVIDVDVFMDVVSVFVDLSCFKFFEF